MKIVFRDEGGYLIVSVDDCGISFCDGDAYFSDGDTDYIVPVSNIQEVTT